MTSKELENFIIEYTMDIKSFMSTDNPPYKLQTELLESAKLVGEEDPFALANYLESMTDESRDTFFKIVKDLKERNGKKAIK